MTIESEVAALTTATTALTSAVNVAKAALDTAVTTATTKASLTASDAVATAADRVQTGLDRTAASGSASAASGSASTATTQAGTATTQAGTATTQAGIATTKAAEAAISAAGALASEIAAGVSAGAAKWVSGTTYSLGAAVWSPVDRTIYRRIVAGAGTTDPSSDTTNWASIQDSNIAKLTYALDFAIDQAGIANKRIDADQTHRQQNGTATFTQSASTDLVRTYASAAVTLAKPFDGVDYQVIAEVVSAKPNSAATESATLACFAGDVVVSNRATNGFTLSITGSAVAATVRWRVVSDSAAKKALGYQTANTSYYYGHAAI
jgi:hypothetical protein